MSLNNNSVDPSHPPPHAPKILVGDVNDKNLATLQTLLETSGYLDVTLCRSAQQVLAKTQIAHYDVIFLNLQLEDINILHVIRELKSRYLKIQYLPLIGISGHANIEFFQKIFNLSVPYVLQRPFQRTKILCYLKHVLQTSQLIQSLLHTLEEKTNQHNQFLEDIKKKDTILNTLKDKPPEYIQALEYIQQTTKNMYFFLNQEKKIIYASVSALKNFNINPSMFNNITLESLIQNIDFDNPTVNTSIHLKGKKISVVLNIKKISLNDNPSFILEIINTQEYSLLQQEFDKIKKTDPVSGLATGEYALTHYAVLTNSHEGYLFYISISNMEAIHKDFGHEMSTKTIAAFVEQLSSITKKNGTVFSWNNRSDFIFLLYKQREARTHIDWINFLKTRLEGKYTIVYPETEIPYKVVIELDIGMTSFPEFSTHINTLIHQASIAKFNGQVEQEKRIFALTQNEEFQTLLTIERDVIQVIEKNEIDISYLPFIDPQNNKILGAETLTRWNHKELGFIPSKIFFHLLRKHDILISVGEWILETACKHFKALHEKGMKDLFVSINIATLQIINESFKVSTPAILHKTGFPPNKLILEISEVNFSSELQMKDVFATIKKLNLNFLVDNFASGQASLQNLIDYEIKTIKLDRSLISQMTNQSGMLIIHTLFNLGKLMNIEICIEGIEVREQITVIENLKCGKVQGFYYTKPLGIKKLFQYIQDFKSLYD